jgi:uncharacterized membrane protein
MESFVKPDDLWVLWAALFVFASASIFLEQKYKWAERLSGPVIGLIFAVVFVNIGVLPTASPVYDAVWDYFIPIGVVMLLFKADIKTIFRDTGKMFLVFNIEAVGTVVGAILAFFLLRNHIPMLDKMAGILTGSYIGGGVNLFAVAAQTGIKNTQAGTDMLSAEVIADNFVMAIVIFVLLWVPTSKFFRKHYNHPFQDELDARAEADGASKAKTLSSQFWGKKEISLLDIAMTVGTAFLIATVSTKIAGFFAGVFPNPRKDPSVGFLMSLPWNILGSQYVILTIVTSALVTIFPNYFSKLKGAQELGTYLMYVFFVVIGCPADLKDVILGAPLLFVFCGLIAAVNIIFGLVFGGLLKQNIEEITVASNANIGGPSTAAAMAVAKGYDKLVVPAILCGIWGYIIGTPLGLIIYQWLSGFMPK